MCSWYGWGNPPRGRSEVYVDDEASARNGSSHPYQKHIKDTHAGIVFRRHADATAMYNEPVSTSLVLGGCWGKRSWSGRTCYNSVSMFNKYWFRWQVIATDCRQVNFLYTEYYNKIIHAHFLQNITVRQNYIVYTNVW